ncbi:MAG TPA: methyltransferase domain-containing protein [Alphaproteobacteria bacterium]|jgi:trans-aconitate 2-methyltransferase
MPWDPSQYLKFAAPRERPALDLLARVPASNPGRVYDLGCGSGNTTRLLQQRWPRARITGVDSSAEMLAEARATAAAGPTVRYPLEYVQADLSTWMAGDPVDLLYSNAALHWLPGHERLFPKLMRSLMAHGALAVQMPRGHGSPRIDALVEIAQDPRWRDRVTPHLFPEVAPPEIFHDWLARESRELDIWETEYLHVLAGEDAVAEWTRGSALAPVLGALNADEAQAFYKAYADRMRVAYPRRADGATLLPFRRIFIVAVR